MQPDKKILLSFDVEEFDLPLEYKQRISTEEQLLTGCKGFVETMTMVDAHNVSATLFVTGFFAENFQEQIQQAARNHEIASHAFYHSSFVVEDLKKSKDLLQNITGKKVTGFRMPRMAPVNIAAIKQAGYLYDSSINPTWIPGRYNHFRSSRNCFLEQGLWRLPMSVSPHLRIPLFWLAFKNLPYNFFLRLVRQTLHNDGYVNLYFHPWEFVDLSSYKIPFYLKRGSNGLLLQRLEHFLKDLSNEGEFVRINDFIQGKCENV